MSTETNNILDSMPDLDAELPTEETAESIRRSLVVQFEGIDPRIKRMSYSSSTTLHTCPRKLQLYKLQALVNPADNTVQNITFGYGHIVGQGIQDVLEHRTLNDIYMRAFMMWKQDLLVEDEKAKKGFFQGLAAIKQFVAMRERGYLQEYELLMYNGKPAVELGFRIIMPDGYEYRGFVDAVLIHKTTGQILVLECKTTKYKDVNPASFKNSAQAIGYSIILDFIAPESSSYTVLYLVYSTTGGNYIQLPFEKSFLQRAHWLRNLLIDKQIIDLYSSYDDAFPMHGNKCYDFFRDCEYLGLCTLDTANLAKLLTVGDMEDMEAEKSKYQFVVQFEDLIANQLKQEI